MKSLNLITLRCADVEVSRKFYELLGLCFAAHQHGNGPMHYAHEDDRGVFELYPSASKVKDETGLGFSADNLERLRKSLMEHSFKVTEIHEEPWGRTCVVRDPDNRRIELKQV